MFVARQSTALTVTVGPVLDASGVAVTDGVVADLKISKNGGAPAALDGSATLTHRNTGHYSLALTASDLDTVGTAEVVIDDTVNAMPVKEIQVVEEAVYDALFASAAAGYPTAAAVADAVWDEAVSGHVTAGTFGEYCGPAAVTRTGTCQGGSTSTVILDSGASSTNNYYRGQTVVLTGGTGAGQSALVTAYTGSTRTCIVSPSLATAPNSATTFAVVPGAAADVESILGLTTAATGLGQLGAGYAVNGYADARLTLTGLEDFFTQAASTYAFAVAGSVVKETATNVTATALAAGSVTASVIATGAIDADALAADAVTEIGGILTTALTEGYRATGATGSVRDLLYEINQHLGEASISSTTKTLKKLDGSTTAKVYTLDSATTPTSITETS